MFSRLASPPVARAAARSWAGRPRALSGPGAASEDGLPPLSGPSPYVGVVFSVVGIDRPGLVSEVSAIIAAAGGNVTRSSRAARAARIRRARAIPREATRRRSFTLGPIFSMAVLADLGADVRATTTAKIQAAVPCHAVSAHPADEDVAAPAFAANLKISCADGVGLIAKVTEFVASSGLSLAKLETASEGDRAASPEARDAER